MDYTDTICKYQGFGLCLKLVLKTLLGIFKSSSVNAGRSVFCYIWHNFLIFFHILDTEKKDNPGHKFVADILNPLVAMPESERGALISSIKTVMASQAEIKRMEHLVRNINTHRFSELGLLTFDLWIHVETNTKYAWLHILKFKRCTYQIKYQPEGSIMYWDWC